MAIPPFFRLEGKPSNEEGQPPTVYDSTRNIIAEPQAENKKISVRLRKNKLNTGSVRYFWKNRHIHYSQKQGIPVQCPRI